MLIAGSNGSGKSVLMSLIAGLDEPTSGDIVIDYGFEAGLIFQDADAQILGETPWEDVMFSAKNSNVPKNERNERVQNALSKTGLLQKKDIKGAKTIFNQALKQELYNERDIGIAIDYINLAVVAKKCGEISEMQKNLEKALSYAKDIDEDLYLKIKAILN